MSIRFLFASFVVAGSLGAANHQFRTIESPPLIETSAVVTWKGSQDHRWSNPGNWEGSPSSRKAGRSDKANNDVPK